MSGEGRQTKGTMGESDLKLMEFGFFEREHIAGEAICIHPTERLSPFLHMVLILIFSPQSEGCVSPYTKQVNLDRGLPFCVFCTCLAWKKFGSKSLQKKKGSIFMCKRIIKSYNQSAIFIDYVLCVGYYSKCWRQSSRENTKCFFSSILVYTCHCLNS